MHDLIEIEEFSKSRWGEEQTARYMGEIYKAFEMIAEKPDIGRLRRERTYPFYLAPVKQHFAVYQPIENGVVIATVLHGRKDIERIVKSLAGRLSYEIEERLGKI